MSKAAVRQMVASLACELAEFGIRINAVAPGTINTEMTRACLDESGIASMIRRIPLRGFGEPTTSPRPALFL